MKLFISYNSADDEEVRQACKVLSKFSDPWRVEWKVSASEQWMTGVENGIKKSDAALVFISENGVGPWQEKEILRILDEKRKDKAYRVIPVLIKSGRDAIFNPAADDPKLKVPWYLSTEQWVEIENVESEEDFGYFKLEKDIEATRKDKESQWDISICPYVGMGSYGVHQHHLFFGRGYDIENVFNEKLRLNCGVKGNNFLVVVGDSGCGKSSFVKAGIMGQLKAGNRVKGSQDWDLITITPGSNPLYSLSTELAKSKLIADSIQFEEDASTESKTTGRFDRLRRVFDEHPAEKVCVLYIDQLEEVLTQFNHEEDLNRNRQWAFLSNIAEAVNSNRFVCLASLRSDFYAKFTRFGDFNLLLTNHNYTLEELSLDAERFTDRNVQGAKVTSQKSLLKQMIYGPARLAGVVIENGVLNRMVAELHSVSGVLPVLQLAMNSLWGKVTTSSRRLTADDLTDLTGGRGLNGIITRHLEEVVSNIAGGSNRKKEIIYSLLVTRLTTSAGAYDLRRTVKKSEAMQLHGYKEVEVEEVIEGLLKERILKTRKLQGKDGSEDYVELVHEVIIREWPQLRQRITEKRESIRMRERIADDAHKYMQKKGELYEGRELHKALRWQKNNPDLLGSSDIDSFLLESKNKESKRFRVYVVAVLLLSFGVYFGITEYDRYNFNTNELTKTSYAALYAQLDRAGHNPDSLQGLIFTKAELDIFDKFFKFNPEYKFIDALVIEAEGHLFDAGSILPFDSVKTIVIRDTKNTELDWSKDFSKTFPNLKSLFIYYNSELNSLRSFENLETLESLDIYNNEKLKSLSGFAGLTSLKSLKVFQNPELTSLEGIENLKILESLEISKNIKLDSLSGFEGLKSLKSLRISGNPELTSLQGFENLKTLESLEISGNWKLDSLSGFEGLTSLKSLVISGNLSFFKGIEELETLESLEISNNAKLKSLSGFDGLTSLKSLRISGNPELTSLQGIENLRTLESLEISGNWELDSFSGFEGLTSLKSLVISQNFYLTSLKGIENLRTLESLSLAISGNWELDSFSGFEGLTSLKSLKIANYIVLDSFSQYSESTSLKGIEKLETLVSLEISGHWNMDSFSRFEGLTSLKSLIISENSNLTSLPGFENLRTLEALVISRNWKLDSLSGFEGLTSLKSLIISENSKLTSLPGFEYLKTLESLVISRNRSLESLKEIENLTSLKVLEINSNNPGMELPDFNKFQALEKLVLLDMGVSWRFDPVNVKDLKNLKHVVLNCDMDYRELNKLYPKIHFSRQLNY